MNNEFIAVDSSLNMTEIKPQSNIQPRVSKMAQGLVGSEIIKLAGEVNDRIRQGEHIYNLTIGDFNPAIFPIPVDFQNEIIKAYQEGHTNYPAANGIADLREAVSEYIHLHQGLSYKADEVLIAGGARPLIYAAYQAIVDKGEKVIFPVPSWNNNHYTHLSNGEQICLETDAETHFMPTAEMIQDQLGEATLLALCSPLNPTGTTFTKEALLAISELVAAENRKRKALGSKPLYVLYDQIYWQLTYDGIKHEDPVTLVPELRDYVIYIDGMSKAYAATGVRVGWAFGPSDIIGKMRAILGHVGAWAPKAEQVAAARYLQSHKSNDPYLVDIKTELFVRLKSLHDGLEALRNSGFPVKSIAPQAAIYLTVQFNLVGKRTADGKLIESIEQATAYMLNEAKLAVVPFYAFGAPRTSSWYRISVGTIKTEEIPSLLEGIKSALSKLN